MRRNKYNAKKSGSSDSKAEDIREKQLRDDLKNGIIADLVVKPQYIISPIGCELLRYTPDFSYYDVHGTLPGSFKGQHIAEDVKGAIQTDFIIRAKLFCGLYPGTKLYISKAIYKQKDKKKYIGGFKIMRFDQRRGKQWTTLNTTI